ncbi:hypothetical protein ACFQH3_19630 [Haladaptatus sp. GCM10025707]|uniref:hypothetical protein n=1 Tax=Haladaptatus sp. GCM10025707 TaxID=3252658 RepID=UPI003617A894
MAAHDGIDPPVTRDDAVFFLLEPGLLIDTVFDATRQRIQSSMDAGIVVDLTKPTGPMAVADLRPATNLVVYCGMEDYAEALSTGASHWAIDEARAYYASMQEVPLVGRAAFFEQIPANDRDLYEVLVGGGYHQRRLYRW